MRGKRRRIEMRSGPAHPNQSLQADKNFLPIDKRRPRGSDLPQIKQNESKIADRSRQNGDNRVDQNPAKMVDVAFPFCAPPKRFRET